jgi:short-subunit dehydrogenase
MKHILITGSTRGIGFGLAKRFIESGLKVTINGTTQSKVDSAIDKLRNIYPDALIQGFVADVCMIHEVETLWNKAVMGFGEINIWINNAGIDQPRINIWEIKPDEIEHILKTNITGVINGSIIAFSKMLNQDEAQIFNMEGFGSDGMIMNKMTLYGTTKRAVSYFTRSMAKEAEKSRVKIGTLSPGMVVTDFLLNSLKSNLKDADKNKKVFNILADDVKTVSQFLSTRILKNTKNNVHITWLTKQKVIWRFLKSLFVKRNLFKKLN